jgi:hypothetical protein
MRVVADHVHGAWLIGKLRARTTAHAVLFLLGEEATCPVLAGMFATERTLTSRKATVRRSRRMDRTRSRPN